MHRCKRGLVHGAIFEESEGGCDGQRSSCWSNVKKRNYQSRNRFAYKARSQPASVVQPDRCRSRIPATCNRFPSNTSRHSRVLYVLNEETKVVRQTPNNEATRSPSENTREHDEVFKTLETSASSLAKMSSIRPNIWCTQMPRRSISGNRFYRQQGDERGDKSRGQCNNREEIQIGCNIHTFQLRSTP